MDPVARLEKAVTVENFNLIGARASCDDQIVRVLLELCCVELDRGGRRQFFVKWNRLGQLSCTEVPQLQRVCLRMLSC